eukprot:4778817-Prymnesium_polylepis.1
MSNIRASPLFDCAWRSIEIEIEIELALRRLTAGCSQARAGSRWMEGRCQHPHCRLVPPKMPPLDPNFA